MMMLLAQVFLLAYVLAVFGMHFVFFFAEALLTNAITLSSSIVAAHQYICISNAVGATVHRTYVSLRITQHMIVYAYMNICVYIYMYPRSIHGIISDMSTRILHMEYIHRIHI